MKDLNRSNDEVWDRLFPLKMGQKVELVEKTCFVSRAKKYSFSLPKGLRGVVVGYVPNSPLISVLFNQKGTKHNCCLEVKKVKRILDE